jgi:hypothetical protein
MFAMLIIQHSWLKINGRQKKGASGSVVDEGFEAGFVE